MNKEVSAKKEPVVVETPENMNLLGLLMKGLLSINMTDSKKFKGASRLKGKVLVQAGEMKVVLSFKDGILTIMHDKGSGHKAWVKGSMSALLGVVTGKGIVKPFLGGDIRFGGNIFFLLKILPLITAPVNSD